VLYTLEDDDDPEAPPLQVVKVVGVSVDNGETWSLFVSKKINSIKVASEGNGHFGQVCVVSVLWKRRFCSGVAAWHGVDCHHASLGRQLSQ